VLLVGLAAFVVAGAITTAAQTAAMAIAGRALQGIGAATMTPASLSLLTGATREGADRTRALSLYGLSAPVGFVAGTLTGGLLATASTWRAAVGLTLVLAAVAAALASRVPSDGGSSRQGSAGAPLAAGLVAVAALGAIWRLEGLVLTAAATAAFLAVAMRLGRSATGRGRPMAVACAVALAVTGTATGATLLLTLFLQGRLGYTPLQAGLAFASFGAAAVPGAAAARRVDGPIRLIVTGLCAQGAAFAVLAASGDGVALPAIVASVAGFGFGGVMSNVAVAALATASAPASLHGALAGMLSTAQFLGGALGPPLLSRAGLQAGMAAAGAIAVATAAAAALVMRGVR
jgi:predicted MFS family arabinose efflux permease